MTASLGIPAAHEPWLTLTSRRGRCQRGLGLAPDGPGTIVSGTDDDISEFQLGAFRSGHHHLAALAAAPSSMSRLRPTGRSFFVRDAYFTGSSDPYKRLRQALKADIDQDAWESLYRTRSRPFASPRTGTIAVKVINHHGDEVLKTYDVP